MGRNGFMEKAVAIAAAFFLLAGVADAQEIRTVCSADVCMPMRCVGQHCTPVSPPAQMSDAPMQWTDLYSRPKPKPTAHIAYGPLPQQFAELWLPDGAGPHPLVVMIHGGCWTKGIANLEIMNYAAEDLRKGGIAVWNIEYRGVDEPGGGYPGTFQDVAAGLDAVRGQAAAYHLRLEKVVAVGHSAGGQLVLWAAARGKLPAWSVLRAANPLKLSAIVDLAGIPNLATDTNTACGGAVISKLVGQPTAQRPDVYADTSPAVLVPLGVPQYVIHGASDDTVRASVGAAYAKTAKAAGDRVHVSTPPGNHVEEIAPGAPSWDATAALIQRLTR
jgi:acetyl esterase/lipase